MDSVSILVPVYNSARFLQRTVASVQAQIYTNWQLLLIVDPKSRDDSEAIAQRLAIADDRISVLQGTHPGVAATRNRGIQAATGSYIAFLDSDDEWLPSKLERQLKFMRENRVRFSCTAFRRISESGERLGRHIAVPGRISYFRLLQQNCVLCSSVILERGLIEDLNFTEQGCEDFALWLRLLKREKYCAGLNEPLVRYRIVAGSRGTNHWRTVRECWTIFRDQERLGPLRAAPLMGVLIGRALLKHSRY